MSTSSISGRREYLGRYQEYLQSPRADHGHHYASGSLSGFSGLSGHSSYAECCPLVVDPLTLILLLAGIAGAAYFLSVVVEGEIGPVVVPNVGGRFRRRRRRRSAVVAGERRRRTLATSLSGLPILMTQPTLAPPP